ncbi:hypothetical protein GUJ93_ZPchr0001g30996 [Zizania palustris]|uniref:Uncharacterized protein n=1 Tax=Zizania palustris TaxID=103762 RepID=A0A8J5RMK4_ZIZPA|nr:hypothetical protein GUJ93_ZPchr0001g30996 [Zizania palustris]
MNFSDLQQGCRRYCSSTLYQQKCFLQVTISFVKNLNSDQVENLFFFSKFFWIKNGFCASSSRDSSRRYSAVFSDLVFISEQVNLVVYLMAVLKF